MRLGQTRPDLQSTRRPSASHPDGYANNSPNGRSNAQVPISIMQSHTRTPSYGAAGFAAARSPPKAKSTSHVPCKFYPMGQCQAGAACQFSHDLDATTQNAPCKYFSRGSCKFGQSCALMHVLPDGRIINRPGRGGSGGGGAPPFGRRSTNPNSIYATGPSTPLSINAQEQAQMPEYAGFQGQEGMIQYAQHPSSPIFRAEIHPSNTSSPYGSPHGDMLLPRSPPRQGLSARDAQLPSSWDSQGISQAARNGPYAASVPGRFGIESPPSSYPNNAQLGNTSLRDRDTAYADTANLDGVLHGLGSSPREIEALTFAKRPLHSERFARPRPPVSSSLDIRHPYFTNELTNSEPESDSDDGAGEDLLPSSLHDLIPADKLRRPSRSGPSEEDTTYWSTQRRMISNGSATDIKPGSMSPHSSSPSRYSAMWAARSSATKTEAETNAVSAFGHVGSPLRPSNLRTSSTNNTSPPPANGSSGLSMLTSQLQRARLADPAAASSTSPPSVPQTSRPGEKRVPSDATIRPDAALPSTAEPQHPQLSSSVGASRDDDTMFSMEDEEKLESTGPSVSSAGNGAGTATQTPPRTWAMAAAAGGARGGGVGVIGGGRGK